MENKYPVIFPNDDNVIVIVPQHYHNSNLFKNRPHHEAKFRQIITCLIINKVIDTSQNFIDLGAWIGDNAIPWAKLIDGIVYAIDPSPDNCSYIEELMKINHVRNVSVLPYAISDKAETLFYHGGLEHTSFIDSPLNPGKGENSVPAVSLDWLHSQGLITNISFIHLDVEGMEYMVIRGGLSIIEQYLPIITFEVHLEVDIHTKDIIKTLEELDYFVYMIYEILPGCRPDCRNFIAVHRSKLARFQSVLLDFCNILIPYSWNRL